LPFRFTISLRTDVKQLQQASLADAKNAAYSFPFPGKDLIPMMFRTSIRASFKQKALQYEYCGLFLLWRLMVAGV